jgi:hypothetical protein
MSFTLYFCELVVIYPYGFDPHMGNSRGYGILPNKDYKGFKAPTKSSTKRALLVK